MLYGKTVLIGITGGIAAYKACDIVSQLVKLEANVEVIMTSNAAQFVQPLTFESLSNNQVVTDMFIRTKEWEIEHISLAKKADVMVIVPATANVIGKLANGIADDMLTTTYMACKAPKIICPAMNNATYADTALVDNINTLLDRGALVIEPAEGRLACGDVGKGKLADVNLIVKNIVDTLQPKQDYNNTTVLITAGATREDIDRVRFISNYSSGKMGIAIARAVQDRGGKVILITGSISVDIPSGIYKHVKVVSTEDMYNAVMDNLDESNIIIKAAAPADYKVKPYASKIKDDKVTLELVKTTDIAKEVGKVKGDRKLVIFSAETDDLINNAKSKLKNKNADIVIANDVTMKGAGFNTDTNIVTLITADKTQPYEIMSKDEVANIILDHIVAL